MSRHYQSLLPGNSYHLFSRAVGKDKLYITHDNYRFFLGKLKLHTASVCDVYCYALLPNHFHALVRIKDDDEIIKCFEKSKNVNFDPLRHNLPDFIMERFSNALNSYAKAFNKVTKRKGALFTDYLKRSRAETNGDLTAFLWYIHKNAVHHGLTKAVGKWPFDSYRSILLTGPTSLLRDEVIAWFGGREGFIKFHEQEIHPKGIDDYDKDL